MSRVRAQALCRSLGFALAKYRCRPGRPSPGAPGRHPFSAGCYLNPNSEIKTAGLYQSLGHKRFGKISPDHCGYAGDFSKVFLLQHLDTSQPF